MGSKKLATLAALAFSLMLFMPTAHSQIIQATGNSMEASSQLVYYYNLAEFSDFAVEAELVGAPNIIQVTNTNDTAGVWIHVQIFRSFDPDGVEGPTPPTLCDERNFVDFLTPNDTHLYILPVENFPKNIGETETEPGEFTTINLGTPVPTEGFILITPVVSNTDLTAISFEYMVGSTIRVPEIIFQFPFDFSLFGGFSFNAMGRAAVDFTTGDVVPDGTPLDGVTNGFVVLQPEEVTFSFESVQFNDAAADIVGITFRDVYGPPGLLGYTVEPASAIWTPFLFDWKESVTSCGFRQIGCYTNIGLHDGIQHFTTDNFGNDLLCAGASTPDHPAESLTDLAIGWTRIFVSELDDFENHLGVYRFLFPFSDANWMNTNK